MASLADLSFNSSHLASLPRSAGFKSTSVVLEYIDSVTYQVQDWHTKCLLTPKNRPRIHSACRKPSDFLRKVRLGIKYAHGVAQSNDDFISCPNVPFLRMKREGKLSFHDHTSMVACLVSRFGRRDGRHIYLEDDELSHTVAAAVLLTVLVDLEDQNGYFGPVLGCAEPVENLTKGVDDKLHFSDSSAAEPLAKTKLEKEVIRDI